MKELPRALVQERMVSVKMTKVLIIIMVIVVMVEKLPLTREFAVPVTHLKEEPGSKMSKRESLIKFNQV